jgi:peptide/nickel transport system substrate-binding protein
VHVVKNGVHNLQPNLVNDDIFRGIGLARPQQFWIEQK